MIEQFLAYLKVRNNLKKSRKQLEALQLKKLKKIVIHAYEYVPYYRKLFDGVNLKPKDIQTLDDLKKIPITTKKTLKSLTKKDKVSKKYAGVKLFKHETSGSTGVPLVLFKLRKSLHVDAAIKLRKFFMNGYKLWWGIGHYTQNSSAKKKWFHKVGIHQEITVAGRDTFENQIKILQRKNIKLLTGMPSRLSEVARYILNNDVVLPRKKVIIAQSETLTNKDRRLIKKAYGVDPVTSYESHEFANIACECPEHKGLHVMMDAVIVETRDDKLTGSAIITDLLNEVMPLIRYEIGDVITLQKTPCTCSRATQMMKKVEGRTNTYFVLPSGKKISGENVDSGALSSSSIEQYQIHQEKDNSLTIHIILGKNKKVFEKQIIKKMKSKLENIPIRIKIVKKIKKLHSGKRQTFVPYIL